MAMGMVSARRWAPTPPVVRRGDACLGVTGG